MKQYPKISTRSFLKETFSMSVSNIRHNRMRSFLTMLGIIIGVTAVVALISIVSSVSGEMMSQFESLGTGTLTIQASGYALKRGLNESELSELAAIENVDAVAPSVSSTADVKSEYGFVEDVTIDGRGYAYLVHNSDMLLQGRGILPLDEESENHICLIDKTLLKKLFPSGDAIGQTLRIGSRTFTVAGVTDESSSVMAAMNGGGNGTLMIPYTTAMKLTGNRKITSLEIYLKDATLSDETADEVEQVLERAFNGKDDSYRVINMESLLDAMDRVLDMMTTLLAGIAAISLLVGGIGIMNMMLVSVTERTTEIGLRKALGAEPYQIQAQFLIESFLLSFCGGILGLAFGELLVLIFSAYADISASITLSSAILGLSFSGAIGILFGWAPARKASNLNPIDALRSV
ncbi:MAG: ABC transporter permease [Candidatus Limiplasma sp.]|nr:ABC transporter permease [Candidatus Limiplasma sp.]